MTNKKGRSSGSLPLRQSDEQLGGNGQLAWPGIGRLAVRTRRDDVTHEIRQAIFRGRLAPGTRLRQIALAAELGVSRPTLREALLQLVHEGVLVQEPFKGLRVADPPDQTLKDIAEVRFALERLACLHLAANADDHAKGLLQDSIRRMEEAEQRGDPAEVLAAHLDFHGLTYRLGAGSLGPELWAVIETKTRLALTFDHLVQRRIAFRAKAHRRLVELILSGDVERLESELKSHILENALAVIENRRKGGQFAKKGRASH